MNFSSFFLFWSNYEVRGGGKYVIIFLFSYRAAVTNCDICYTSSSTLMVPWLLAATITLLLAFQQTALTNSLTSSSFRSRSRKDRTASNLNWNRCLLSPETESIKHGTSESDISDIRYNFTFVVDVEPVILTAAGDVVSIRSQANKVLLIDVTWDTTLQS